MTTKAQSIITAMASALAGAGLNVRDDTDAIFNFENYPVIVLDCGDEVSSPVVGLGYVYWNLTVTLQIGAEGAAPKMAPEPTRATAHTALYADRTLGGAAIDLSITQVTRGIDQENPAAGITLATYLVKYRALEGTI
ncbi:MAG: hypothetical protein V4463_05210 [Pseudomonadota bacterium]